MKTSRDGRGEVDGRMTKENETTQSCLGYREDGETLEAARCARPAPTCVLQWGKDVGAARDLSNPQKERYINCKYKKKGEDEHEEIHLGDKMVSPKICRAARH